MTDYARLTKAELLEEVERLRRLTEELSAATGGNGKFDEAELFDLAGDVEGDELFLVTETGRIVYVNDAVLDMLGYGPDELVGMSIPAIDPNNSRAAWLGRVSRLKQTGEPDEFETEHQAKDGSMLPKSITALYVSYRSRNYVLCVGSRIERGVEDAAPTPVRSREKTMLQTVSDGVLVVDTRGSIIESNNSADRMLGVAKSEIIGRSCVDTRWRLVDGDGDPLSISNHPLMITMVEEQPLFNRRINMLATDGTRRMLMINASPLFDESGNLSGAIGCIRPYEDSVERREQQLQEERQGAMFRAAVLSIVTAGSVDDLERQFCDVMAQRGDFALVWRGVKKDTDERIHPSYCAGASSDFLMKVKVRYDDSELGNGPLGRAVKTGEAVIVQDLSTDPSSEPWLRQADRTGLHSLAAFPLRHDGEEAGLLTLYSRDRNHFSTQEVGRLKELMEMLSHGLVIRQRIERTRALHAEIETHRALIGAYESLLPVAVARFDTREPFRCQGTNTHFAELLDEPYRSTGIEGYFVSDFMYSLYHRDLYQQLQAAAGGEDAFGEDTVFTDWQGKNMHWSWRILPVTGDAGQQELLYVAYRLDRVTGGDAGSDDAVQSPSQATASAPAASAAAEDIADAGPAMLRFRAPKFGPRAKVATRIERFMDEGQMLQANRAALRLFGVDDSEECPADPSMIFDERSEELLSWLFAPGDLVGSIVLPLMGRDRECRAFVTQDGSGQEYLLLVD